MQPCAVCGGVGVDASGYCTQCRTFRGHPAQVSGAGYGGTPHQPGGAPHQPGGAPQQPGPPSSGGPYQAAPPSSGAPYQPAAPGGPYPPAPPGGAYQAAAPGGPYPPAPPGGGAAYQAAAPGGGGPRSRSFVVPLVALSATLAILVVAIVVVVVVRSTADNTDAALVDRCVVGVWEVTRHEEDISVADVGNVKFVGRGTEVRLTAKGSGTSNFKDGTSFTANVGGLSYTLVVSGTINFDYRTDNGTFSFSNVVPNGKATVTRADTGDSVTEDLTGSADPARYTCVGDTMTEYTNLYRIEMSRVSRTG